MDAMPSKTTISVRPDTVHLITLLERIAEGKLKIPVFQRDFIWTNSQMMELFDSIVKGYPIGSLLFWNPEGVEYKTKENIGPYKIKNVSQPVNYILDGFQRISTLFGVLTNPSNYGFDEKSPKLKNFLIYYDLKREEFTFLRSKKEKQSHIVPLYRIVDSFEFIDVLRELENETPDKNEFKVLLNRAKQLSKIFLEYKIAFVEISRGDIKSAVDIFSRINSTGTDISTDYMISALSYDESSQFVFTDTVQEFRNNLNIYNFENIKTDWILNCISNAQGRIYFDVKIESLVGSQLKRNTEGAFVHIEKAIEFIYKRIFILDIRLLPYPTQLIFISEFLRLNPYPTEEQYKSLENWFWITTYSNYFTIYSLSQQRAAYEEFCDFALGNNPDGIFKLGNEQVFSTAKYPEKAYFGSVRSKALQLFYLKSIVVEEEIQEREGIKEIFITSKKDRTPANIIFRLSSEFEKEPQNKTVKGFIENSSTEILSKHFITPEMVNLYKQDKIDEFILKREKRIKEKEKEFVKKLRIKYSE